MAHLSTITVKGSKRLTVEQELELLRLAHAREPGSLLIRARLATLMEQCDLFDDVIGLLDGRQDLSFTEFMMLIQALLAAKSPEATLRACAIAQTVVALATTDGQRADALADLGKAQVRLGDANARTTLEQALMLDPANKNACKRLAALLLDHNEPQGVLDFTHRCASHGAAHAGHFAAQVLALARLGRFEEARLLDGRQLLGMACQLPLPSGWHSMDAFNTALADQLLAHPGLQYERSGTASENTWRVDTPNTADAPLVGVLLDLIRQQVDKHIGGLGEFDHPWLISFPEIGTLHCNCLITDSTGYEAWHMHEFGSLTGVYYVTVPSEMDSVADNGGCLAFGLPPDIVGEQAATDFGLDVVKPAPGQMRIFPSHCYHRTYPHNGTHRRICIAFDVRPG